MNLVEAIIKAAAVLEGLTKLRRLLRIGGSLAPRMVSSVAYENVLLDYLFDIRDRQGRRATIRRVQRIRFRFAADGIVRDLVWGEGNPLKRYSVLGARCLGVQQEGPKRVVLLALPQKPRRGDIAKVVTSRAVQDPVPGPSGYAESSVERPTRRLGLKVLFPRSRPPLEAHLVVSPPDEGAKPMRVRYGSDGRPFLSCRLLRPRPHTTYSLRWLW